MRSGATVPRILVRSRSCITGFELFVIGARASWTYGGRQRGLPEASRLRVVDAFTNAAQRLAALHKNRDGALRRHAAPNSFTIVLYLRFQAKQKSLAFFFL